MILISFFIEEDQICTSCNKRLVILIFRPKGIVYRQAHCEGGGLGTPYHLVCQESGKGNRVPHNTPSGSQRKSIQSIPKVVLKYSGRFIYIVLVYVELEESRRYLPDSEIATTEKFFRRGRQTTRYRTQTRVWGKNVLANFAQLHTSTLENFEYESLTLKSVFLPPRLFSNQAWTQWEQF